MPSELQERLRKKFKGMMSALYKEKGAALRIDILREPEVESFIQTHADILDSTFAKVEMSDSMRENLQRSDYIFSGFKTFHEINESYSLLLDENGNKKPFNQFLNDVKKIDQNYNERYLRAEYNFASASSDMAAKWEQFAKDEDEYYLQYRTANDGAVRPEHAALHDVTLPASDSFWDSYYPPNGWNCRCTVVQVLRYMHEVTPHNEAMRRGAKALSKDKKGMFNFNPGKQQKTFPDYNPYTISKCKNCDIAKERIKLTFNPSNDLCSFCRLISQAQATRRSQRLTQQEFRDAVSKVDDWANSNLDTMTQNGQHIKRTMATTSDGYVLGVGKKFFIETAHKNKNRSNLVHILKVAKEFKDWIPNAIRIRTEPGNDHNCDFSVYEVVHENQRIEFKCRMTDGELLHNMRFI